MKILPLFIISFIIVLSACSKEAPKSSQSQAQAPWQPQLDALEKAKGLEGQMMDADQKRRQDIERMSQ